jgi:acyl-CoA thioesterase-1
MIIMVRKILLCSLAALAVACGRESGQPSLRSQADGDSASEPEEPVVLFLGTSLTGLDFRAVNAGVSGETSAGGLRRIDWLLRQPVAVLVLELGANDMLRGQDIDALRSNLQAIIDRTRAAHPDAKIVIAGMRTAPNLGATYAEAFEAVFVELAESNDAPLIPFLLDGVAGIPELNQPDGNHPTAAGQMIVARNVWKVLEPVLRDVSPAPARL